MNTGHLSALHFQCRQSMRGTIVKKRQSVEKIELKKLYKKKIPRKKNKTIFNAFQISMLRHC